jgi:acyl-CoA synthetase
VNSLAQVIERHAGTRPESPAYLAGEEGMSWAAYDARSTRLAALLLGLDLARGDRVGVLLPDGPGVHAVWVGCEKAGLVVMGIGPRAGLGELEHLLRKSGARALISRSRYRDEGASVLVARLRGRGVPLEHHLVVAGELEDGDPIFADVGASPEIDGQRAFSADELFLLNSTSGTTGLPKCVTQDQRRWIHFHDLAVDAGDLGEEDVFMSVIPAPFGFGIWTAHVTPTLLGAPVVVMPSFDAEGMLEAIERHRVSVLAAVTTQFIMMLNATSLVSRDLSSLRVLFTGGEAVPQRRAAEFEDRTGARVLQFYGSNETGALSRTTLRDSQQVRLGSAGHVIESMQVRLFDDAGNDVTASGQGQPGCRGALTSQGYYEDSDANAKLRTPDGWMLTGDVVTLDEDGVLSVIGRTADFIIRGGKNVSAKAVEDAVATHPAVALAAAVAMPDEVFGERVCVYVEVRAGETLDLSGLLFHLASQGVSKETLPERLVVVEALPRSSGGKVAKQELRDDIARRVAEEAHT